MNNNETKLTGLALTVSNSVATISANFAEVNQALDETLDKYRLVQYSDDADEKMRQMKNDRSELNKLTASIKAVNKDVKEQVLAPYTEFNEEVLKLLAKVEEPKILIDQKIKELEEAGREAKRKAIREYFDGIFDVSAGAYADFKEDLYKKLYDPKWENATATQKAYKEGLKRGVDNFVYGMQCLRLSNHAFMEDGIREFKLNLDLSAAIQLMEEKQRQTDELIKKERERMEEEKRRIEEEARAEAERKIAEEKAKAEAEAKAKLEAERLRLEAEANAKIEAERKRLEEEAKASTKVEETSAAPVQVTAPVQATTTGFYQPTTVVKPVKMPSQPDSILIEFKKEDWAIIKKYADRMEIKYAEKH